MASRKKEKPIVPIIRIKKGDSLKTIYAKARKAFTADDLYKYLEPEPTTPARELLAEMEALDAKKKEAKKRSKKGKPGNGRTK